MKNNHALKSIITLFSIVLCLYACSKSSGIGPKTITPPPVKTPAELLESAPWKISQVDFIDGTTGTPFGVDIPDSLKNLVITFNPDNTFTETGAKTATGNWALAQQQEHVITIVTVSPASIINWSYSVSATSLGLTNTFIVDTYINPDHPLNDYVGEELGFTH